jgi:hypothetical protein
MNKTSVFDKIEEILFASIEQERNLQVFVHYQPGTLDLLNTFLTGLSLECVSNEYQGINLALITLPAEQIACLAELHFILKISSCTGDFCPHSSRGAGISNKEMRQVPKQKL